MLQTDLIAAQQSNSRNLLIALHGLGDSMEGYRWVPNALGRPDLNVLLVNAPDAYYGGFSWFDFASDPAPGIERSYGALALLLDDFRSRGFPTEKTILFGFSQGCLMTMETGLRYPHKLAGCIGVSGWVHQPERLLKQLSPVVKEQHFLVTHGSEDPLIRLDQARPTYHALEDAGIRIDFRVFSKPHTIIQEEIDLFEKFIPERLGTSAANSAV
jgi:phospholipase/carboxylesterase